jgi:type IV fimbrial biogenesis protein FimT
MLSARIARGFTLIELMIGIAVLGLLLMVGLPSIATFMQNTQIRTSAEALQGGLQLARAEALKRNVNVRFQLVSTLDSSCALSNSGANWVVSLGDPSAACNAVPSETAGPRILQKRSSAEGSPNAAVSNPGGGACAAAAGQMRCLRVTINSGGTMRMCDPAVTDVADPRMC